MREGHSDAKAPRPDPSCNIRPCSKSPPEACTEEEWPSRLPDAHSGQAVLWTLTRSLRLPDVLPAGSPGTALHRRKERASQQGQRRVDDRCGQLLTRKVSAILAGLPRAAGENRRHGCVDRPLPPPSLGYDTLARRRGSLLTHQQATQSILLSDLGI